MDAEKSAVIVGSVMVVEEGDECLFVGDVCGGEGECFLRVGNVFVTAWVCAHGWGSWDPFGDLYFEGGIDGWFRAFDHGLFCLMRGCVLRLVCKKVA